MSRCRIIFVLILALAFFLRIYKLGGNPPSLYWDEASLGYNAYSILTSGHDEHGEYLPIARFIAFGDYKPPGYIYATVPSIYLFGLNEFAVRFPSAIAGILIVLVSYLLVKELFGRRKLALLAGFLLSVSPWAVHFSRAAFEANLAALFNLLGVYLFILSGRKKSILLLSIVSFILSFYTFNANRIIAPLMLIGLSTIYIKNLFSNIKWLLISIVIAVLMLWPSVSYLTSRESKLRFQEVSIFNDLDPIKISNNRINLDNSAWWSKLIHNRRVLFAASFLKHYFDNFSGRFLFTHGDVNPRLNLQEMGQLYVWDLPFLLIGLYWLIRKKEKSTQILLLWMLIVPIPAACARETPHALRILSILPTYQIIIAYGVYQFILQLKIRFCPFSPRRSHGFSRLYRDQPATVRGVIFFVICFLLSVNCYYYLHNYYVHYPRNWSGEWQYGYKQMVAYVSQNENKYDQIFVTSAQGRPYIFFAFYQKWPFESFYQSREAVRDWFGFWNVESLGKISFNFDKLPYTTGRVLLINSAGDIPNGFRLLTKINNLAGEAVYVIAEKI